MNTLTWCPICRFRREFARKPPTFCPAHPTTRLQIVMATDPVEPAKEWALTENDRKLLRSLRIAAAVEESPR